MGREDNTYEKLIEAGIRLFGHNDFTKVSTRDLTKAADACLGGLFYHFGSKENLYTAVVQVLTDEAAEAFNAINFAEFQNLDISKMQQEITRMIYSFNELFISENGISCTNIFNREATLGNISNVARIIRTFAKMARSKLNKILIIYYTKINLPVENVEFIITLMFSILKNRLARDGGFYDFNNYEDEILKKLIELVLYQKLV